MWYIWTSDFLLVFYMLTQLSFTNSCVKDLLCSKQETPSPNSLASFPLKSRKVFVLSLIAALESVSKAVLM